MVVSFSDQKYPLKVINSYYLPLRDKSGPTLDLPFYQDLHHPFGSHTCPDTVETRYSTVHTTP